MQLAYYPTTEHDATADAGRTWESFYVLSVPWIMGIASFSGLTIGGLHYTGYLWLGYLAFGLLLILWHRPLVRFPVRYWMPLLAFALVSMLWSGGQSVWQFQMVAQMTAPLVIAMVASLVVRTEEQAAALETAFLCGTGVILASFFFFYFGPGQVWQDSEERFGFALRPAAMSVSLISCLLITGIRAHKRVRLLMWGLCLLVTVLTGGRTATAAILLMPMLNPLWRGVRVRVALSVGMLVLAWALFSTPLFQSRFFGDEGGTLADLQAAEIDTSGRDVLWPILIEEAARRPLLGAGIGTSTDFLSQNGFELHHPHNEYIRVGFELGIVGLILFCGAVLWQALDAYRNLRVVAGPAQRLFAAGLLGLGVLLLMSVTDNPMVYNLPFLHPLFVLLGAAYGLKAGASQARERA